MGTYSENRSYFDGGYWAYIGYHFLANFVTIITLGIAYPWMCCMLQRWEAKHTVVCGRRKYFDGKGAQLFGKYILWWFLTVITLGIYGLWLSIAMRKWVAKHTHFEGEEDNNSYFDGGVLGLLGTNLLAGLVSFVPFVGVAWGDVIKLRWEKGHTVTDSRRLIFAGSVGSLFLKYLVWGILTIITLGIFAIFMPVKLLRWQAEHTIDNEHTTEELIKQSEYRTTIHTDAATFKTNRVENEMEAIKAGITDTISQEELLKLANKGVRAAQYAYVTRYAEGEYTQEPFSSMLKAAAEAEFAPAMCLYARTHGMDEDVRTEMVTKAAEKGEIWALRNCMTAAAYVAQDLPDKKESLPTFKKVVRYADLLKECGEELSVDEIRFVKEATFAIRRIQSQLAKTSAGKTVLAIVIAVFIGIPLVVGVIACVGFLFMRQVPIKNGVDMNLPTGILESGMDIGSEMESLQEDDIMMAPDMVSP